MVKKNYFIIVNSVEGNDIMTYIDFTRIAKRITRLVLRLVPNSAFSNILSQTQGFFWEGLIMNIAKMLKGSIPQQTICDFLTGKTDARTEVASELMRVLKIELKSKKIKKGKVKYGKEKK